MRKIKSCIKRVSQTVFTISPRGLIYFSKRIDQVLINLTTILISGIGVFTAITKFNLPETNMSFWGENPFIIKRDIIENEIVWIFSLLALFGLLLQVLREIHAETISERLYRPHHYYLFFLVLGILMMCILVPIFTAIGQASAKQKWLPKTIENQKEVFQEADFIIKHNGWREDQVQLKEKLDNPQKYIDINYQTAGKNILQIEQLLEIKNPPVSRLEKINNLKKYFTGFK
jgi:hypothetical protein